MTKDDFADVGKVKVGRTTRFVTYYINDDDIEEIMALYLSENGASGAASRLTIITRTRLILAA